MMRRLVDHCRASSISSNHNDPSIVQRSTTASERRWWLTRKIFDLTQVVLIDVVCVELTVHAKSAWDNNAVVSSRFKARLLIRQAR